MRIAPLFIAAALAASPVGAATSDTPFLDFPYVDTISAAKVPAFAWLTRQADKSMILFARAPQFRRVEIASRSDVCPSLKSTVSASVSTVTTASSRRSSSGS